MRSTVATFFLLAFAAAACSSSDSSSSDTSGGTTVVGGGAGGGTSHGGTGGAGGAATGGQGGAHGGASGSPGSSGHAGGASGAAGSSNAGASGSAGSSAGTSGSGGSSAGASAAGGSSAGASGAGGSSAGASGTGGSSGTSGAGGSSGGSGAPSCIPTNGGVEICDGHDNDCNGIVDDVDVNKDGICDCLRIGIVGNPGANPSSNFQSWLQAKGTTVKRVDTMATDPFDATLVDQFDILIFDWLSRPYTAAEAATLTTWVQNGGGFVTMTGYANNANPDFYPNALLQPFGLAYVPPLLVDGPVTTFVPHPITTGITSVTFDGGYAVQAFSPTAPMTTLTPLASLPEGNVAYAVESGNGRGFVWGDEWIEFDSEWSTMPQIQTLWVNVIGWVGPRNSCIVPKP